MSKSANPRRNDKRSWRIFSRYLLRNVRNLIKALRDQEKFEDTGTQSDRTESQNFPDEQRIEQQFSNFF